MKRLFAMFMALALTALELIQNPEELAAIKAEHAQKIAEQ